MKHVYNCKGITFALIALALIVGVFGGVALRGSASPTHAAAPRANLSARNAAARKNPFCRKIGKTYRASAGALISCFGPQQNNYATTNEKQTKGRAFGSNVDAANPSEDISPNGTQAYGQSEVSTAGTGSYVVEAWNDSTGLYSAPCSPMYKDQLTGFGFSNNGGKSFTDEGGLPNINCSTSVFEGDPSVETWQTGRTAYFYISGLFFDRTSGAEKIAMDACQVTGSGSSATLSCNSTPIIIGNPGPTGFLDKDFLSIDPKRGLLYASYTNFSSGDTIDLSVCDIGGHGGTGGALGGTAATPVCVGGDTAPAAVVIASSTGCNELEGAYPGVDLATGNVYVAYENNWATNQLGCQLPIQQNVNQVSYSCIAAAAGLHPTGTCADTTNSFPLATINIVSMDSAFIPGYNRFPMNDFPRIAVSDTFSTVSIVWNDARFHPVGDILLQSFNTSSFPTTVQSTPVVVNSNTGGWHMLPALRNVDDDGDLNISFYGRASGNTDVTNVYAGIDVSPRTTKNVTNNQLVTTAPSAWIYTSSDFNPNFGDYTDNYVIATPNAPYTQQTFYVAWSDGRTGVPQPFNAHAHTN